MTQLICTIQVQQFAAFPDASADSQTVWISDGVFSHLMLIPSLDTIEKERAFRIRLGSEGNLITITKAIFVSENIHIERVMGRIAWCKEFDSAKFSRRAALCGNILQDPHAFFVR